jgi:FkbM family methyltransferase
MLRNMARWDRGRALPDKAALGLEDAATRDWLRRLWEGRRPWHPWHAMFRHFAAWQGSFLDVGAHLGQSLVSLAMFAPRMQVFAFEPNPLCAEALAFAARLVPNEVRVFLCALGERDEPVLLHVPVLRGQGGGPSSNASLRRAELDKPHVRERLLAGSGAALRVEPVPAMLRRIEGLADPPGPLLVKIDVEGSERQVLEGLGALIARHRPPIVVERNNWPEIADWLARENYAAFDYDPETALLHPVPPGPAGGFSVDPLLLPVERTEAILAETEGLRLAPP